MISKIILITIILFLILTVITFIFNRQKIKRVAVGEGGEESYLLQELTGSKSLKHDLITYFMPVLILVLPFLAGNTPTSADVIQAATAFLAFTYLKRLYWNEI